MHETRLGAWHSEPPLSAADAYEYLVTSAFKPRSTRQVGVELEWLVYDRANPTVTPAFETITDVLAALGEPLPAGSLTSTEPGGQPELASAPASDLHRCLDNATLDLQLMREAFTAAGLTLAGIGLDPLRKGQCLVHGRRQEVLIPLSMPEDPRLGHPTVNTAGVQVNVDCGDDTDDLDNWRGWINRWRLLHHLGPLLTAAFANSPYRAHTDPTGAMSTRQLSRLGYLATRAEPPLLHGDVRERWAEHILNTTVLFVRTETGRWHVPENQFTVQEWCEGAGPRRPSMDDLLYHLSTVWPPIRARGYYELRMMDALPGDGWIVPTVLVHALLEDEATNAVAQEVVEPLYSDTDLMSVWRRAAIAGPTDPVIGAAVRRLFEAAGAALGRLEVAPQYALQFESFAERYPLQGRCPAQDLLKLGPMEYLGFSTTPEPILPPEESTRWSMRKQHHATASDSVTDYERGAAAA